MFSANPPHSLAGVYLLSQMRLREAEFKSSQLARGGIKIQTRGGFLSVVRQLIELAKRKNGNKNINKKSHTKHFLLSLGMDKQEILNAEP